jgi:hypothetical protein
LIRKKIMSTWQVPHTDKKIIRYLQEGGDLRSDTGLRLVRELVWNSCRDPRIGSCVLELGLDQAVLVEFYIHMLDTVRRAPLINHGGWLLIPSLPFMDEKALPPMLELLAIQLTLGEEGLKNFSRRIAMEIASAKGDTYPISAYVGSSRRTRGCLSTTAILFAFTIALPVIAWRIIERFFT